MMKIPVAGVYISWPFCAQKCTYCNFASGVLPRELEGRYLATLLEEISSHGFSWQPDTVYLGGGTPSAMETDHLCRLLGAMPGPWREATIEAAPGTVTTERIDAWLRAGINRVSLGVQSFVRQELARTGRKHSGETVVQDVAVLRAKGLGNFNIDLIAGLPGQSESNWNESLAATIALDPPHVSVYMLEVDDDSRLGAEILLGGKRYGATDVPSDDRIADFYETAVDRLRSHGIQRYEISIFARPGAESIHNLKYWKREPYLGFGADAHSFDGTSRWQNVESAQDYVARSERGDSVRCEQSTPDPGEEKFFVGLRLAEGVHADEADWLRFGSAFDYFLSNGFLERVAGNLRLTPRGVMVSNEVFQEFLTT
jgi:oxygen-independent coproporphyrinogen III oxidase